MTIKEIQTLTAASAAFLDAHEQLLWACQHPLADRAHEMAHLTMSAAREAIGRALAEPAEGSVRYALLQASIELDGLESPLAALATRRFEETMAGNALCAS